MGRAWFAPDDPYLPPPWKGVIDGNTGRLYYWNLETNITQYEKPAYWVQSSCSPPSFYHSPVTASSDYPCPYQYPNLHPQYQRPAETVINGFKFPQQFPFPNPTNTSTSQPIYPQSNSLVEPIYPNFRSFQPEHDLNPSIPIFQSPLVPTFLPQTQFLNPFPSFGVGSSNAPTTTTRASTPSLDSTPSQPLFGSTPSPSLTSGSNSSLFGPPVSTAISGTTSSSSSQPPISDLPEQNEVPHSKLAVSTLMDELQKPRQSLSVAIAEGVNLAVQVDHASSGRNSDAKLKSNDVVPSNGVDLAVLDANLTAVQLLQDLTDEDTVDENDEPPPILVNGFVDDNEPGDTTYRQSPPQVSLSSVEIPVSGINALECYPLSVVRIDECLPWLDFVLIVEKNFVLMVKKNENSVNRLETIEDAGELFLIMPERNIISWKTLISALVLNGQEEKALGVYDSMISEGMVPTHFSLATLLGACEGWLDVEKGIELNVILYNTLLLLCADIGYTDQAIKIFEDVKSSETWKPDSWTFSSMMTIYSYSGKVSEAKRTLNEMMEAGNQLNILILISLIQFYGKEKRTDDVVEAFNQLQQLGITPDERFCGYLLNVMTQTPKDELPELTDCIERGNEKLGYVVRPLVEKQDSSQNFRKEASELFNSVGSDMKAYYNCFINLRVNLQLLKRACEFLNLGLTLEIYTDIQSKYPTQWSLYLKGLSVGAVFTALHVWINDFSRSLESEEELPILFGINTENGQTKAISQTRSFSIAVIDFLKVNSVFSSSRYTYGPVVSMITVASQSVVHLIFHAWLLLIHAHKHNIGKRTSLVTLPYFALGTASHVLKYLSVIFVNVSTHKKAAVDVICHTAIFYVEFVFFLHMQMVEKLMPSPIVEFPGHSMTKKEIVAFWIWLPTTLLHLQTKVILLENTYTGAYFQVAFVHGLTIVLQNVNEDFHMVYSTLLVLSLFNCDIPHVAVWSRYCRLDYISEQDLMIMEDRIMHSAFTVICQSTIEQPKIDEYIVENFEGAVSTWGCSSTANGKAMMELYVGLYTNIGFHDFALNSQSPTLGFELFANMKFINVLCKNMVCKILNQMDPKDIIASGATSQSHMLYDKATEFSRELNQANACTLLSNYGHGKMKRLVQESEETNGKCTAPAITPIVSEGNEQVLVINVILQVLDFSTYSVDNLDVLSHDLGDNGFVALHLILCLLNNGESKTMVINWLSKVKTHAGSSTLNVDRVKVSNHLEDKSDVLRATQMTNLEEKNDLFPYFLHWGITLIVFYSEFVSAISNYDCFLYNNLGAAFDNTMTLQLVSIVAYARGTSLHAFHRD